MDGAGQAAAALSALVPRQVNGKAVLIVDCGGSDRARTGLGTRRGSRDTMRFGFRGTFRDTVVDGS